MSGTSQIQNETFKYNSTTLYKNNLPLNIDIDSICDDLYKNGTNKEVFNEIMSSLEKEVLSSDIVKKTETQYPSPISTYPSYSNYGTQKTNKYSFKSTIPEGELMSPTPYHQKVLHKKYTDVNANSKYYYPNDTLIENELNKSQWTNRANRIILDSHNNFNSTRIGSSNYTMNNNNMTQMLNSGNMSSIQMGNTTNPYMQTSGLMKTNGTYA